MSGHFIDTYLCSPNKEELEALKDQYCNMLPIVKGREAIEDYYEEGILFTGSPQIGDPNLWYTCVRCIYSVTLTGTLAVCDTETGIALCGVWSNGTECGEDLFY